MLLLLWQGGWSRVGLQPRTLRTSAAGAARRIHIQLRVGAARGPRRSAARRELHHSAECCSWALAKVHRMLGRDGSAERHTSVVHDGGQLRADAAALESILIRYVLDTGAESTAAASRAAAVAAAHRHVPDATQRARSARLWTRAGDQQRQVNSATCSMTIATAAHTAAMPAAHRFDLYVMRQTRLACLEHRVATFGLLRLHYRRSRRLVERAIVPHFGSPCQTWPSALGSEARRSWRRGQPL